MACLCFKIALTELKRGKMDGIKTGASNMTTEAIKALATTGEGAITAENKKTLIELATLRDGLNASVVPAYYCTTEGLYGGNYYESGKNYRGLEAWSSLTKADHSKFTFNYDALDLLIDPNYTTSKSGAYSEGQKYQYDGNYKTEAAVKDPLTGNPAGYSVTQSVDYTATYNGSNTDLTDTENGNKKFMVVNASIISGGKVYVDQELSRDVYEALPNLTMADVLRFAAVSDADDLSSRVCSRIQNRF